MTKAEQHLRGLGITDFKPGFQDSPAFLAEEAKDRSVLKWLAAYIDHQVYQADYLAHVRAVLTELAPFLYRGLKEAGRLGACVDASGALGRMLEREGIWNYCVKGGMSIYPESWTGVPESHYAPLHNNPRIVAGHAWVVAPPFRVIDLTLKIQPNQTKKAANVIPDFVLSDKATQGISTARDWIDQLIWHDAVLHFGREPTLNDIARLKNADTIEEAAKFGVWEVKERRALIRYIATDIGGFIEPLEAVKNVRFGQDLPVAYYERFCAQRVTPKLGA